MLVDQLDTDGSTRQTTLGDFFANPALEAERVEYAAGSTIHDVGADAANVYFVQQGQVRLYLPSPAPERAGSGRLLEILGASQWFGFGALSHERTHITRAVAMSRTVLLVAKAEKFLSLLSTQPELAISVVRHLADSVRSAREDSARLVFDDCNQRLIKTLVRFSSSAAATQQDGQTTLQITHEQLAQAVGVARETVSLALTEFRHQNLVRTGRNQLIFNTEALQQFGVQCRRSPIKETKELERVA